MSGPEAIGALLTEVQVVEGYEQSWEQLQRDWPSKDRMVVRDGKYETDLAYATETGELTALIRGAIRDYGTM